MARAARARAEQAVSILGYAKDEAIGKNLVDTFIQPEDRKSVSDVLSKALVGKETANYELPLLSKHGERFTILLNATTRRDATGNITGVVGVGQDSPCRGSLRCRSAASPIARFLSCMSAVAARIFRRLRVVVQTARR